VRRGASHRWPALLLAAAAAGGAFVWAPRLGAGAGMSAAAAAAPRDSDAVTPADTSGPLPARGENERALQEIRQKIRAHRDRINALDAAERDAASQVKDSEEEIRLVKTLLRNLDTRERILQRQSDTLRVRLARHQAAYAGQQGDVGRRLRALYVHGPLSDLAAALTSRSYTSLVARLKYASLMAQFDRRLLERTRREGQEVVDQQRQLQVALAGIWEARAEAGRESGRLEEVEAERVYALRGVQKEKQKVQGSLASLEANERKLTDLLASLERQRLAEPGSAAPPGGGPFAALQGALDWPVAGRLVRPFGRSVHPEFKTVTVHNGISIAAAGGAPVYAVAAGTIEFVGRLPGYGVCIILDHGDGYYSLYAHTARVFVQRGQKVSRGQVVAEVGTVEGTDQTQLYFEIRHGKTPVDPQQWLKPQR
jgi:septal ring factor EnvC (AmiA/AmiB activator)